MNFLDKLDFLMARKGLRKTNLSEISGVPYTTIDAFYKKGFENVKMSTVKKLANALDVSLDYLLDDRVTDPNYGRMQDFQLTGSEVRLIRSYRELDDSGKSFVEAVTEREYNRVTSSYALSSVSTLAANSGGASLDEQLDEAAKFLAAHPEFGD